MRRRASKLTPARANGGKVQVPKGFAMMDRERLRDLARAAIDRRWELEAKRAVEKYREVCGGASLFIPSGR